MNARAEPEKHQELFEQMEWFRVALSSIGDAVIATDAQGRITFMNPVAQTLTGWSDALAVGKLLDEVFRIVNEENHQPVENPVTKALRENTVVGLANHTLLIRKDGSQLSIADSAAPIRDRHDNVIGVVLVFRDVSQQRQDERDVRDAREFAENIVDTVRHPLLVLGNDLRVQAANRSFYKTFQVSRDETENQLIYDLGNRQWDIPELRRLLTEILPQNTVFDDFEVEHNFLNLGVRSMLLNARRLYRAGNHTQLILLAIEDVTERRLADEERREIETRFTSLVKNIKDHSIFTLDREGYITSWNWEAERILGFSEQEALGEHFSIIFTEEDRQLGIPQQELTIAGQVGRAEDERWHRRKNGELFWALGIVTPTHDAAGNHTGFSKILRDMTDRKRAEETLLRQSQQLHLLWDSAEALLTAADPSAMLRDMFSRVSEHLDVDAFFNFVLDEADECLRLVACAGVSDEEAHSIERLEFGQAVCGTVAERKQPIIADHIQQSNDPNTELIKGLGIHAYACNPLIFEDRLIGTLSFASRTQEEFAEEELAFFQTISRYVTVAFVRLRLVQELQEAHRRKDEFLAMLAHELRNPLAPIRSGLDILAMEQSASHETIELMQAQMSHVVRLVDDLMDVSRIMRGKVELRKEPVELATIIHQSVAAVRPSVEARQQQLVVAQPTHRIWLDADPIRLVQIFENLLNNASKYTDAGGRIELMTEVTDAVVTISVCDNGIGIAPDLLPVVFDLFTQSPRSLDRANGGLGIGLTLVKNLIELHGGSITVRSEGSGLGSCFAASLPISTVDATPMPAASQPVLSARRRIIAVDDNRGAAYLVAKLLEQLGEHEVATAHDGRAVLAMLEEFQPEIVLLDIGLPGMDGYEVARKIREQPKFDDVLLVALTGYGQAEDQRKTKEAGFDEHLVKPASIDQLRRLLTHSKLTGDSRVVPTKSRSIAVAEGHRGESDNGKGRAEHMLPAPVHLDARQVKHDVRNTLHMLKMISQMLATNDVHDHVLQVARDGLAAEMERLQRIAEWAGQEAVEQNT